MYTYEFEKLYYAKYKCLRYIDSLVLRLSWYPFCDLGEIDCSILSHLGSDINRVLKFPLIPVLIVSSSLVVAAFIYIALVVWGRFQRKRNDDSDSSSSVIFNIFLPNIVKLYRKYNYATCVCVLPSLSIYYMHKCWKLLIIWYLTAPFQILVPPRALVHSSFGHDGYFPFRSSLVPSYNQFFYRSLSIDSLYRQYQNTKNSIPSMFLPSHRGKNKSSSITANQRLLLIPRVSIPRAHLQSRNVSLNYKLYW